LVENSKPVFSLLTGPFLAPLLRPCSVPLLEKNRKNIDQWERRFQDYSISKNWRDIINGIDRPLVLTQAEVQVIPAASRYVAQKDRNAEIKDFNMRSDNVVNSRNVVTTPDKW